MTILLGSTLFGLGFVICAIIGGLLLWSQLYSIGERLNQFSIQNNMVLANLNNPAVSGLMNQISTQERESGFHNGYNLAVLSLFKTFSEGQVCLDFDDMKEALSKNSNKLIEDQKALAEWDEKFTAYHNDKDDDE